MDYGNLMFHRHHHIGDMHLHQCTAADIRSDAIWKAISIAAIYVIGMLFCILPITLRSRFSRTHHYTTYLGMANSFAAGVFLSLGLIHLLPEGEERLAEYYGASVNAKYRLCYLMCALGYTCILMLERVVFTTPTCAHHMHKKVHQEDACYAARFTSKEGGDITENLLPKSLGERSDALSPKDIGLPSSIDNISQASCSSSAAINMEASPLDGCIQGTAQPCDVEGSHIVLRNRERIVAAIVERENTAPCIACENERVGEHTPVHTSLYPEIEKIVKPTTERKIDTSEKLTQERLSTLGSSIRHEKSISSSLALDRTSDSMADWKAEALKGSRSPSVMSASYDLHEAQKSQAHLHPSPIQPYVLMAALSAHGLSEGLALGVERGTRNILLLFLAIMAHKWAEGLALGISFSKTLLKSRKVIGLLCAFSLSTPVGIGIGWLAQALMPGCAEGYFLGFSSGSFLYIGASEVVVEEFIQGKRHWGKFSCFLAGLTLIYLIFLFLEA